MVELDPVVVDVAYGFFRFPRDPRLTVDVEDGRRFLERDGRRWDVIGIDAYFAGSIPFHLTTREFLELVRERLEPGGAIRDRYDREIRTADVPTLTDDYAPTDALLLLPD